jgi:hypothetical protein
MTLTLNDLPDWTFDADEVSMGVYRVRGRHRLGWTIELTAESEEALISSARKAAQEVAVRNAAKGVRQAEMDGD